MISLIKILFTLFICAVLGIIIILKAEIALVLSILLCFIPLFWIVSEKIDEKKFILFVMFIYPLLPLLWGISLGPGIPVFRAHRLLMMLVIFFLIRKGLFIKFYTDFFKANIFTYPIIFVLISMLMTSFTSTDMKASIFFTLSTAFEFLILSVIIFSVFKDREDIDSLINVMFLSATILCFIGIYESYTQNNIWTVFGAYSSSLEASLTHAERGGAIRINGPFEHSISFGAYLSLTTPMIIYKYKDKLPILGMFAGILFYTLMKTQSRGSQISFGVIILYFVFIMERKYIKYFLVVFVGLLVVSGSFRWQMQILNPFFEGDEVLQGSSMARIEQFHYLKDFIMDRFIFGHGMIAPPNRLRWLSNTRDNYNTTVDSFYLLYSYYFGIIGLVTWTLLNLSVMIKPLIVLKDKFLKDDLIQLSVSSVLAFFVINLVVALWSFHFMFWIYMGIIARLVYNTKNEMITEVS